MNLPIGLDESKLWLPLTGGLVIVGIIVLVIVKVSGGSLERVYVDIGVADAR